MVSRSHCKQISFLQALDIRQGDVVCFAGAGGKTSLMFRLAGEAREQGLKVLVTTTTKIFVPDDAEYDALSVDGSLFSRDPVRAPGIYVGGQPSTVAGKMAGADINLLASRRKYFDLVLIEADGAAQKSLKGWNRSEPVIPLFATKTIGIIDIQTIGATLCAALVHRLDIFCEITGSKAGELVTTRLLLRMILHDEGLFRCTQGTKILYVNKVESDADCTNVERLREVLEDFSIVAGSIKKGTLCA
ncbi:MAG: selenium cofactor biosynthesis protein YqeC [Desulforhopalus sp.]